ncbi:258_t:CDS:1, partial [Scutellospora calospora]
PQCKNLDFISSQIKKQVIQNFQQIYNEQKEDTQDVSETVTIPANTDDQSRFQNMLFNMISAYDSELETDEFLSYQRISELHSKQNSLIWWESQKERYKVLYKFACQYLAILATSTPSERLFSAAEIIMNSQRTLLEPKLFG